jgi:uncharacterized coiled-coil DUF342 family protein
MNTRPTPETDAAWACFKGYMEPLQDVQDLSRKLERERDEAREELKILKSKYAEHHSEAEKITSQIQTVTAQRDRMAEAINAATILIAAKGRHNTMLAYEGLREALQSLTPNAEL